MIKPLPELNVDDFKAPYDFILAFYRELGWNSETQELDPRNIQIHSETWGELCNGFRRRWGVGAALAWMNCGPSGDENNPYNLDKNQIKIEKGAMIDLPISALC